MRYQAISPIHSVACNEAVHAMHIMAIYIVPAHVEVQSFCIRLYTCVAEE